MRSWSDRHRINVSAGALIILAEVLLLVPLRWVGALALAAVVHEGCHALAVYLFGGHILRFSVGPAGAVMETTPMEGARALVCSMAGPIGSFSLLLLLRWLPRTALCGLAQGCFNLLPLLPLDGGRMTENLLTCLLPGQKARVAMEMVQWGTRSLILIGAAWVAVQTGGGAILAVAALLYLRTSEIKLAKKPNWRYNKGNIDKGVRL